MAIDFDGIDQRVVPLPIPAGDFSNLQAGAAGQVYYLQAPATRGEGPQPAGTLHRFDLTKRKTEPVAAGVVGLHRCVRAARRRSSPAPRARLPARGQRPA